jgi:hypothetical protein
MSSRKHRIFVNLNIFSATTLLFNIFSDVYFISMFPNCRLQIELLNEKNNLGIRISSMMDLVVSAMNLPGGKPA